MTDREFLFIEDEQGLAELKARLQGCELIGLDAEMTGMHSYRTYICLLQVATEKLEAVVDTLAVSIESLGSILENPDVRMVLHGAVHDVRCMKADFDISIRGLFDTYIAAQLLGLPKLGLSSLVEDRFGVEMDKGMQTVDWRKRPLREAQLEYVRADVRYLLELESQLRNELVDADLVEEAQIEFSRVEELTPQPQGPDPGDWRRVKGSRDLSAPAKAILRELWLARDVVARKWDQPPGRLMRDSLLIELVKLKPRSAKDLKEMRGFPRKVASQNAQQFLEAIRRGEKQKAPPKEPSKARGKPPTSRERKQRKQREDALKAWRKKEAAHRGIPTMAVLPTYALDDLVRNPPEDLEDLKSRPGVGGKRAQRYGDPLLELLRSAS